MNEIHQYAHRDHLQSADELVTTYQATRAGFVALALEKNRRATPYVAEARGLQEAASIAKRRFPRLDIHLVLSLLVRR